jgi:thymidylate synthase (FAD)
VRIVTDRAVTHELVRHRIGVAYSQESQRYLAYRDDVEFILPVVFYATQPKEAFDPWCSACESAELYYKELLEKGVAPQIARSVLPNSTKTEIFVTANLREWRHIFNLRCSKKAHPQIRALMTDIRNTFAQEYPIFFKDLLTFK